MDGHTMSRLLLGLCALGIMWSVGMGHASAQAPDMDAAAAAAGAKDQPDGGGGVGYAGAELGLGQVDEDFYATLGLSLAFRLPVPKLFCDDISDCVTSLNTGLRLPLRLRLYDAAPEDAGVIRREDWDELSDYARIVRYVEYGVRTDPLYARLGEFNGAVIGHGTIMNRYFNVLTVDQFELGFNTVLNANIGGVEVVLDNLFEPEVFGLRVYGRPNKFIEPGGFWDRYSIGLSLVTDVDAPLEFERISADIDATQPLKVTREGRLVPTRTANSTVIGIDQELVLIQNETIDFTPYLDLNTHLNHSPGLYLGAQSNFRPDDVLNIYTKMELRWLGEEHIPVYFSALYEIERESYFGWEGQGDPKLVVLRGLDRGAIAGAYGELTFDLGGSVVLTGSYEDYQGPDNASLLLQLQLPSIGPLSLGMMFLNAGFDGLDEAFELDNALLSLEGRYNVTGNLYVLTEVTRLWRLQDDGSYQTVTTWQIGGGVALGF